VAFQGYDEAMLGISTNYVPLYLLIGVLWFWYRAFYQRGRFSILSLLLLTALIALWLAVCRPSPYGGMF
jgi:hypothetical protein